MDSNIPPGSVNKPSGLPRPSKLPLLRSKASHSLLPKQEDPNQEDVVQPSNSAKVPSGIQKRKSTPSFRRPAPSALRDASSISKPSASKQSVFNGANYAPNTSIKSRSSNTRPLSRTKPQDQAFNGVKTSAKLDNDDNEDQLSVLRRSRSVSRSSPQDDVPIESFESVNDDLAFVPAERTRSSRPSLSDRTIESIQNLPGTPKDRRRSSFFSPAESPMGPMGPPPRPSSSMSRNGSNGGSRPGTSDGNFVRPSSRPPSTMKKAPASAKPASRTSLGGFGFTPQRSASNDSRTSQLDLKPPIPASPKFPSPSKKVIPTIVPHGTRSLKTPSISKTTSRVPPKPRPALADAFGPAVISGAAIDTIGAAEIPAQSQATSPTPAIRSGCHPSNSSSAALRQQIAAAKAAARKGKPKNDLMPEASSGASHTIDLETQADPFNQAPRDEKHILRNRINAARMDGKLNIAAMSLKQMPDEVLKMYGAAAMEESKVNWAEVVDLTRLNAADNEIEEIDANVFPDITAEDLEMDDQTAGNQFGGLEVLDLHGNRLKLVPPGLRRLERLTTLNLAYNKLENDSMDIMCQIESLKELKLGHNALSGTLPTVLCNLQHLETLDLQANRLLVLPEALRELVSLRVLNVSGNQLTSLPMEALQELNLTDLDASSNALIGALFAPTADRSHPTLRSLRVANNSLAALTFADSLELPQLRTLDVTNNHLNGLPQMSGWTELTTLLVTDNKLVELPRGFTDLLKLKNVNLAGNDIRLLDPAIAKMESLETMVLASNPLREKKFLKMSAADVKRDLRARLEPQQGEDDDLASLDDFHDAQDSLSTPPSVVSPTSTWTVKANNGELDLAGRGLSDETNDILGSFLQRNEVKQIQLSSNKLTAVPPALWLGQDLKILSLSGNSLGSDYLSDELELPALQELNISRCGIATLEPLVTQLRAPNLKVLNLTLNRLTGAVPALRMVYPALSTLLAGENKFTSVTADSLRGLSMMNLASNNIENLPAEIGLLWDEGLRNLDVSGNAFRVPNYRILEKGTETVMRFLRNRIPAAQNEAVVNGNGDKGDGVD